jgi:hypothetical protein
MSRRHCQLVAAVVAMLRLGIAHADPAAEGVASTLFEQARQDMRRGEYAAACPKLAESQRLDPSSGTLLNLMVCEEKVGKVASAWVHGRELMDRLPPSDDRRPIVQRKLAVLEPRVPSLTIHRPPSAPKATRVTLDDVELGASSFEIALRVDPGRHRILVTASGRRDRASEIDLEEGKNLEWMAEPGEAAAAATSEQHVAKPGATMTLVAPPSSVNPDRSPAPVRPSPPRQEPPRWMGWTAVGIGAAGLVAGTILGAMTLDRKATVDDTCPNGECNDQASVDAANDASREGRKLLVGTVVSLTVAAGGLGLGVYFLTRQESAGTSAAQSRSVEPAVAVATWATSF